MIRELWIQQALAVVRLEWKKTFLSKRGWWIYLLALGPVVLTGGHSLNQAWDSNPGCSISEDMLIFAGIFQVFYLRLGIFFGCVGVFANLFRSETLEKTLHYYLLAPMRREVLVAGKFLAGIAVAATVFTISVGSAYLLIAAHFGQATRDFMINGPGLTHLAWYLGITALACVGYGAVFLGMGMLFRNPMIPAAIVMVWENINLFLPQMLKKFSVIYYLQSLVPVTQSLDGDQDPLAIFQVAADPIAPPYAILGLLMVAALILWWAGKRARTFEVSYSE